MPLRDTKYEIKNFSLDKDELLLNETLFHNANGYIGVRSVFEEGYPEEYPSIRGQYINGFYDIFKMVQPEALYGLIEEKQTMLNVVDTQSIKLLIGEEKFSMFEGEVLNSRRWVDWEKGITGREVRWRSPLGKEIHIFIRRMTSFYQLSLFTIDYQVTPLNFSGDILIISEHNGNVVNHGDPNDPRTSHGELKYLTPISCEVQENASFITSHTSKSNLKVCTGVTNILSQPDQRNFIMEDNDAICQIKTTAEQGQSIRLIKYTVFCDVIHGKDCRKDTAFELKKAISSPIEKLYDAQEEYMRNYWDNCNVEIDSDDSTLNTAVHYNLFQLIQSVGKDKYSNVSPKGLSGEGYEGHYFWDTEVYIQPFFTITNPYISKRLIEYRYEILDEAKEHARILGHKKGALYPWRTIMGKECSGYFPTGSAQYHINGDIAHSIIFYYLATKDLFFIEDKGAEIIFETARLWLDVGNYYKGRFHINNITGPDEYTTMVNDNYYTNVLAQNHLNWAVKFYNILKSSSDFQKLIEKIELTEEEVQAFKEAADAMTLLYDENLKINLQDDSFLQKGRWDMADIPKENFPLLLHYHPLHLNRYQVCKQPDALMAHFMLEDAQSYETMLNSYHYYEKITTHDSSLSTCIFCIMAAKFRMGDKALAYFGNSAHLDLLNLHKNTKDGIHVANMGGTYMAIVYGFGGFRLKEEGIFFAPILPKTWRSYNFEICYEDTRILVCITEKECIFEIEQGQPKRISVYGKPYYLEDVLKIPMMGCK